MRRGLRFLGLACLLAAVPACGPEGPEDAEAARIANLPPDAPLDQDVARWGEDLYRRRGCLACHTLGRGDVVGPDLLGVTESRAYAFFRAMVLRPDSMLRHDPVARELLRRYVVPMPDQGVTESQTRAMWEYLRLRSAEDAER